jgi:hypothetical protein
VRRHELDGFSLVFGLLFVGAALVWGLAGDPAAALRGWPLPTLLIAVGLAGLATSLGGWRRRRAAPAEELGGDRSDEPV